MAKKKIKEVLDDIYVETIDDTLDYFIDKLIKSRNEYKENYDDIYIEGISQSDYSEHSYYYLSIYALRDETDEEYNKRMRLEKEITENRKQKDMKQLKDLALKYNVKVDI